MSDGRIDIDTRIDAGGIETGLQQLRRDIESIQRAFTDLNRVTGNVDQEVNIRVRTNSNPAMLEIQRLRAELERLRDLSPIIIETQVNNNGDLPSPGPGPAPGGNNGGGGPSPLPPIPDINDTSDAFRQLQREIREMDRAFRIADMQAMRPFRQRMLEVQRDFRVLASTMGQSTQTNQQFMNSVKALGAAQKKASEAMMNANTALRTSFLQTVGTMLNMSTQASKISANYERMGNPLYRINRAGLAAADGLNQLAFRGNAAVLALSMLGPNASMVDLRNMTMMITQGLMRFQMVAIGAAVSSALLYGALHKAAMENKAYKESFETMLASLRKAFEPMVQVFSMVMIKVYDFVNAVAQMIIKFNEAHPLLAKIIQGIMMLIPALTLLLSPLAIGIGLTAGFLAAWSSVWMLIGPLITGLAAMSATVWLVAAAIVVGVAVLTKLWKTNENFRNSVMNIIGHIQAFGQALVTLGKYLAAIVVDGDIMNDWLKRLPKGFQEAALLIGTALATIREKLLSLWEAIKLALTGDFSQIGEIFKAIIPTIIAVLVGGIPGLIIAASRFIPAIMEGIRSNAASLSQGIADLTNSIIAFLNNELPRYINIGMGIIVQLISGLTQAAPQIMQALMNILNELVNVVTQVLPSLINIGMQILQSLITGILKLYPVLIETGINLVLTLVEMILSQLPFILDAGIKILMAYIDGMQKMLPPLIQMAVKLVTSIVDMIIRNLPMVIDSGMKVVNSVIAGIVRILPQLITTAVNLITQITNALIKNLPKIIDSGVKILLALIDGIVKILPKLVTAAISLITKIVSALIENLPKIIEAGMKILTSLIEGIVKIIPQLITAAIKIITAIVKALIDNLPQIIKAGGEIINALAEAILDLVPTLYNAGVDIMQGLVNGIQSMAGAVWNKVKEITGGIKDTILGALKIKSPSRWMRDEIGKMIPAGIAVGIEANTAMIDRAMNRLASGVMNVSPSVIPSAAAMPGITNSGPQFMGDIHVTIPISDIEQMKTVNDFFGSFKQVYRSNGGIK